MTTETKSDFKPDFTRDNPWEGVPADYLGYVPTNIEIPERSFSRRLSDKVWEEDGKELAAMSEEGRQELFEGLSPRELLTSSLAQLRVFKEQRREKDSSNKLEVGI